MTTTSTGVFGRAMLVNLCVSLWEARKHDQKITEQVNAEHAADRDAGRYHKHLFGGKVDALEKVLACGRRLRATHWAQTLPWTDAGWRILPTANYFTYADAIRKGTAEFDAAVEAFVEQYPQLVEDARARLNGMYRAEDYPRARRVRERYKVTVENAPLPTGADFRVNLPKDELARVAKETEGRVARAIEVAMQDAWARLGDALTSLRNKLDDGKGLRAAMVERVGEVAQALGQLNLTNDPLLEKVRKQVLTDLATFDAQALREDERTRDQAARKADAILKQMKNVYAPPKPEDKEDTA